VVESIFHSLPCSTPHPFIAQPTIYAQPNLNYTSPWVPPCEALSTSVGRASELLELYDFEFYRFFYLLWFVP